ncbi:hypothetical protein AAC387_Pa02g4809 [Persea americana]
MTRDEVGLLVGVKKELRKLSSSFTAIQAGLEDAENQQVTKKAVRDWLGKLKDVAYEMEDILEEWRIEALRPHGDKDDIHKRKKVLSCLQFPCLGLKQVELRHDIGHKTREITERLSEISTEKSRFSFNEASTSERPKMEERETTSLIDESEIFGRDVVKDEIVNELVSETCKEKRPFFVVSIVGMGGLGKTTLAQLVYNDETIKKHFEKRIWVCVSEDYDVNKILTKVVQSMGGSTDGDLDLDTLHQRMSAVSGENRFLLVLDDVWDGILWERLKVALKDAALGSRIVVTTRSRTVADVMETTRHHYLGILSDLDCWKLFISRAFRGRNEAEWPPELTEVGKQIVHRCKGVPLAIKAFGSLLYFKRTKVEWQMVLESETWEWKSPGQGVDILPALLLSYYNLPIHLKQCLSFFSLFPKDYKLRKDELVKLWMAHEEEWGMLAEGEMEKMERVFEGLRPRHSNLKFLIIENYAGSKFPRWLEDAKFSSLVAVGLNCKKCRLLPGLGKLPSLEYLDLDGADEIKVVGGDFYGNGNEGGGKGRAFPKLKKLVFKSMPNWEEWKLAKEDGEWKAEHFMFYSAKYWNNELFSIKPPEKKSTDISQLSSQYIACGCYARRLLLEKMQS